MTRLEWLAHMWERSRKTPKEIAKEAVDSFGAAAAEAVWEYASTPDAKIRCGSIYYRDWP